MQCNNKNKLQCLALCCGKFKSLPLYLSLSINRALFLHCFNLLQNKRNNFTNAIWQKGPFRESEKMRLVMGRDRERESKIPFCPNNNKCLCWLNLLCCLVLLCVNSKSIRVEGERARDEIVSLCCVCHQKTPLALSKKCNVLGMNRN